MSDLNNELEHNVDGEEMDTAGQEIYMHFTKANEYLESGNLEGARDELKAFLKIENMIESQLEENEVIYTSSNIIEYMLCCEYEQYVNESDKVVMEPHIDLTGAYLNLGCIEVEFNNLDTALEYFEKALKYNPYNMHARFEMIDIYKKKEMLDLVFAKLKEAHLYIYKPEDLARYYRDLGYYYIENNEFDIAKCLYVYSSVFDDTKQDLILNELNYIYSITHNEDLPEIEKAIETLSENKFKLFFDVSIIKIVYDLERNLTEDDLMETDVATEVKELAPYYRSFVGNLEDDDTENE